MEKTHGTKIYFPEKSHHEKYKHDWWARESICSLCDKDYTLEKHIEESMVGVYWNYMGEDLANMHCQRF